MCKIVNFIDKNEKLKKWLDSCKKDFEEKPPETALVIWETKTNNGFNQCYYSKFNCDINTLRIYTKCLEDKIIEQKIEEVINKYYE